MKFALSHLICLIYLICVVAVQAQNPEKLVEEPKADSKEVVGTCAANFKDCLTQIMQLAQKDKQAERFRVQGGEPVSDDARYSGESIFRMFFDRKKNVLIAWHMNEQVFGRPNEWSAGKWTYFDVDDALLNNFARRIKPGDYWEQFEAFCKARQCPMLVSKTPEELDFDDWTRIRDKPATHAVKKGGSKSVEQAKKKPVKNPVKAKGRR